MEKEEAGRAIHGFSFILCLLVVFGLISWAHGKTRAHAQPMQKGIHAELPIDRTAGKTVSGIKEKSV